MSIEQDLLKKIYLRGYNISIDKRSNIFSSSTEKNEKVVTKNVFLWEVSYLFIKTEKS